MCSFRALLGTYHFVLWLQVPEKKEKKTFIAMKPWTLLDLTGRLHLMTLLIHDEWRKETELGRGILKPIPSLSSQFVLVFVVTPTTVLTFSSDPMGSCKR